MLEKEVAKIRWHHLSRNSLFEKVFGIQARRFRFLVGMGDDFLRDYVDMEGSGFGMVSTVMRSFIVQQNRGLHFTEAV